jgi:hypothetical protein
MVGVACELLPKQYGDGSDGTIIVTGTDIDIKDIYENDSVSGVITKRGTDKGLNHGVGSYQPKDNTAYGTAKSIVNAVNFIIQDGASLTCSQYHIATGQPHYNVSYTKYDGQGMIWIVCLGKFLNKGTVNLSEKGFSGGKGGRFWNDNGDAGYGGFTSAGQATGGASNRYQGYAGASAYGEATLQVLTTYENLFGGSGGGAGSGWANEATYGTDQYVAELGGSGGGALRVYAPIIINEGTINNNGGDGGNYGTYSANNGKNGGRGGGSGGAGSYVAVGGTGGNGSTNPNQYYGGGAGSSGGAGGSVYLEGFTVLTGIVNAEGGVGATGLPARDAYTGGGGGTGGTGSDGRISIVANNIVGSTTPSYYDKKRSDYDT